MAVGKKKKTKKKNVAFVAERWPLAEVGLYSRRNGELNIYIKRPLKRPRTPFGIPNESSFIDFTSIKRPLSNYQEPSKEGKINSDIRKATTSFGSVMLITSRVSFKTR